MNTVINTSANILIHTLSVVLKTDCLCGQNSPAGALSLCTSNITSTLFTLCNFCPIGGARWLVFALLPQIRVRQSSARRAWVIKCEHLSQTVSISSMLNIQSGRADVHRARANEDTLRGCGKMQKWSNSSYFYLFFHYIVAHQWPEGLISAPRPCLQWTTSACAFPVTRVASVFDAKHCLETTSSRQTRLLIESHIVWAYLRMCYVNENTLNKHVLRLKRPFENMFQQGLMKELLLTVLTTDASILTSQGSWTV